MKYRVIGNVEYVIGHLRYGHYKGTLDLTEEEVRKLQENPNLLVDEDYIDDLDFEVDDYEIEGQGPIYEVFLDPIEEKEKQNDC